MPYSFGMLHHCYEAFNKPFYAKLTMKLAEGAENGDKLCQHLFYLAGEALAKHLLAVRAAIDPVNSNYYSCVDLNKIYQLINSLFYI